MNRFEQVCGILDAAVGGPGAGVAFHGAFWRDVTRDEFVELSIFGRKLLVIGDAAASNLVRALRGQAPFGDDLPEPPAGAQLNRMPSGLDPVPEESIAVIESWIADGCPLDDPPPVPVWRRTGAPEASSRTDDIWFTDRQRGWAVNSNGQILHTDDGFTTWTQQLHDPEVYLRCVGFADETRGWVGTLTRNKRLFTTSDGGATWTLVTGLPALAPSAICGLSVVDASTVYAAGTNFPNRPPRMVRTVDGGASWQGWDMSGHATLLVDTYFTDADHGWVVGGLATVPDPGRKDVHAVVLRTEDGGRTWVDRLAGLDIERPLGEWGWKIHFVDQRLGFVALESFERAAVLKTVDGGDTWTRIDVHDPQGNANIEGVGFLDEHTGWVGGWGSSSFQEGFSSATTDGGKTWADANEIGRFINRFRFFRGETVVGYASGRTVYRYSTDAPPVAVEAAAAPALVAAPALLAAPERAGDALQVPIIVPAGAGRLVVDIWDRFGEYVRRLVDERDPDPGARNVEWDGSDTDGVPVTTGSVVLRITVDGRSESRIAAVPG
jgi:photosystem II stability/assembly factor-like uncharacterized protein